MPRVPDGLTADDCSDEIRATTDRKLGETADERSYLAWQRRQRCEAVDDPVTQDDRDAIIKVTSCAICGSDLHL